MRTDLIDDFRLDLHDPEEDGARSGMATMGEHKIGVAVYPEHPDGSGRLSIYIHGERQGRVDCWVDVAPKVKAYMDAKA